MSTTTREIFTVWLDANMKTTHGAVCHMPYTTRDGGGGCPLCTDGAYSAMGGMFFDMAEDAISALSTPNEPLTLDKKRVIAESCLHYSKSGRCGLNGYALLDCPRCKEWQSSKKSDGGDNQ